MKQLWLFFLLFPCLINADPISWHIQEEEFSVNFSLSSSHLPSNESLEAIITLTYPNSYRVLPNKIVGNLLLHLNPFLPQWNLSNQKIHITEDKPNFKKMEMTSTLIPVMVGTLYLSPFKIDFLPLKEGLKREFLVPAFPITISQALQKDMEQDFFLTLLPLEPQYPLHLSSENKKK